MSSTVTISDPRSYIKIETLRDKNPIEIHDALSEVCGELTVGRSTVSRRVNRFHGGCVSIDNDPRPERPRKPTHERSVTLVADALEKVHRATYEELSRATGAKTSQGNALEPTSLARGWATHSPGNARPYIADLVTKNLRD